MTIKKILKIIIILYYIIINIIIIIIIVSVTLILCYCFYCVLFCMYLSAYNNNIITIIYTHTDTIEERGKEVNTLLSLSALNIDFIFRPTNLRCPI